MDGEGDNAQENHEAGSVRGRALYNFLQIKWQEDKTLDLKSWQIEDYRALKTEALFERLSKLGISSSKEHFCEFAQECAGPEELVDCLWTEEEGEQKEEAYLILFELWRRLLPQKPSLSLFCDELDRLFALYDKGVLPDEEPLQEALADLENILDQHVDEGSAPREIFQVVSSFCAHDLEAFIYDYIADQIDGENIMYASELLDGFYEYTGDRNWFDFLRVRIFNFSDTYEAEAILQRLIEQLAEEPEIGLYLEIVNFLVEEAHMPALLRLACEQTLKVAEYEGDFQEFIALLLDYYQKSRQPFEEELQALLTRRSSHYPDERLNLEDPDIKEVQGFLQKTDWNKV